MTSQLRVLFVLTIAAVLCVSCGNKSDVLQRFSLISDGEQTAFAQTLATYPMEYDSSSMGVFVKSVNGFSSTKTAYWLYFINSKPVPKAANDYVPAAGDTIEWRLVSGY